MDRLHGNGPTCVFLFWSKAGKFKICNQNSRKKTVKSAMCIISNLQTELAQAVLGNIGPRARLEVKYKKGVSVLEQKQRE